jgi:predicted dehydrogenase
MNRSITRRAFVQASSAAGLGLAVSAWSPARAWGANGRLNMGVIGVGGRGAGDLAEVAGENIVALCDVDADRLDAAGQQFPQAKKYLDYRELIEQPDLDAVVVATPDHHHAPASVRALRRGLHVYCEKPLTHTVREARLMAELAAEKGVATQMGTQNHEHEGYLRLVELIDAGAIGPVRQVHVITDRPGNFWQQGLDVPADEQAVPPSLHWDLWLGPAAERPYHPAYVPFRWRGWWDFGCGAIGDMAIHLMDPAFWGLKLGGPVKVSSEGPPPHPASGPTWMISRFEFGEREGRPPCQVVWYEGTATPPAEIAAELPMNGSLFVGDEGRIAIAHDGQPTLLPAEKYKDYQPPEPSLPRSPGHHRQWIEAAKTGSRTGSNFQYAGPFTEVVLLGNVAYRVGKPITWDPAAFAISDVPEANDLLGKEYRSGWEL